MVETKRKVKRKAKRKTKKKYEKGLNTAEKKGCKWQTERKSQLKRNRAQHKE